jgi:Mrp family chromosome partitioning ATPase
MEKILRMRESVELDKPHADHKHERGADADESPQHLQVVSDRALDSATSRHYLYNAAAEAGLTRRDANAVPRTLISPAREFRLDITRIDPHLVTLGDFDPRAADEYNKLAVSLISVAAKKGRRRIMLASAQHREGRTSVALNLAGALARAKQRVMVVDCDLKQPSVLRLLGVDSEVGVADAIARGLSPGSAAVRIMPHDFDVLATRERMENSAELLASPGFHEMLRLYDPDFDFMLFDTPPLLESADAHLLLRLTDATLLVVRPGQSSVSQMAKAMSLFTEDDLCGVVINRVSH